MLLPMAAAFKQAQLVVNFQEGLNKEPLIRPKDKAFFFLRPKGTGKSLLVIDLTMRYPYHPAEIVNSDKMQVYNGLDVVNKKVPEECRGIVDPNTDLTSKDFRYHASVVVEKSGSSV